MNEEENTQEPVTTSELPDVGQPENTEDDVVAMCADCGTVIPDRVAEKDVFLQAGNTGTCKSCGGPVIVTYRSQVETLRERSRNGEIIS